MTMATNMFTAFCANQGLTLSSIAFDTLDAQFIMNYGKQAKGKRR